MYEFQNIMAAAGTDNVFSPFYRYVLQFFLRSFADRDFRDRMDDNKRTVPAEQRFHVCFIGNISEYKFGLFILKNLFGLAGAARQSSYGKAFF